MGLVASGKPFFAWVHFESFPAQFLEELKYPYRVVYRPEELGEENKIRQLSEALLLCLQSRKNFVPVSLQNPVFAKFTALAMTKAFVDTFQKLSDEEYTLQ